MPRAHIPESGGGEEEQEERDEEHSQLLPADAQEARAHLHESHALEEF